MIIPILTAFLTFIGVLAMVGSGRINPDFAWISAGVAGCSTGFVVLAYLVTQDRLRDTPEPRVYKVRLPIAMATVKRALKTFYEKRNRWRINYEDKQTGEIQASFYITDDSLSELAWAIGSERIEKTINLTLFLVAKPNSVTELRLHWKVDAEYSRLDCNLIIDATTSALHDALIEVQEAQLKGRKQ